MRLVLASASPRRLELLKHLGLEPDVIVSDIEEVRFAGETPQAYSQRIATEKGLMVAAQFGQAPVRVLSADTEVVLGKDVFGKPRDAADAARMLRRLSGIEHLVLSSVCMIDCSAIAVTPRVLTQSTRVYFRSLSEAEIDHYVASGEPMGKAGAYAIQGLASAYIARIDGSYSSVMGLPLYETAQLLGM